MRAAAKLIFWFFPLLILAACVSMPDGPSIMALPGKGKNFDQFRHDDYECRHYAYEQIDGTTTKNAVVNSGLNSAAIGAALGAIAGIARWWTRRSYWGRNRSSGWRISRYR